VLWVYDAVRKCIRLDDVILATDSEEVGPVFAQLNQLEARRRELRDRANSGWG